MKLFENVFSSICFIKPSLYYLVFLLAIAPAALNAEEPSLTEKTTDTVSEVAKTTTEAVESTWEKINQSRLVNRSRDEVIAWLLMGVLVGSAAGMMTRLKPSGLGKLGRLGLGLAGALVGGMVVRVGEISFDWGVAVISYEELLFSFIGAIVLILLVRLAQKLMHHKSPSSE